jgi:hypothetical protein
MLYRKGPRELWYYNEAGNFVMGTRNMRGVRQGCVMEFFLFCLKMKPVYARLRAAMGEEGTLFPYSDDSYLIAGPENGGGVGAVPRNLRKSGTPYRFRLREDRADTTEIL